jgi:hypothetical protein
MESGVQPKARLLGKASNELREFIILTAYLYVCFAGRQDMMHLMRARIIAGWQGRDAAFMVARALFCACPSLA